MTTRSIRPPSSSTGSRSLSPARASSSTIAGSQRRPNSAANRNPPKPYGSPALWNGSPNRTNPNEPSPLRRLLSLIETNELRPATKLIFAGGPRLRIPFAPPVCPSQQGPADDVGQRRGLCRRSGPGSGLEKAEQRRPAGEGPMVRIHLPPAESPVRTQNRRLGSASASARNRAGGGTRRCGRPHRAAAGLPARPPVNGLPGSTRRRDLQRQYRRKPLRCQRTSVAGLKTTAASSKEGNSR